MTERDWVPDGIDLTRPSVARVYDYLLGGFHNFPADRQLAESVIAAYPLTPATARAARSFLTRAVLHLARDHGVRQFLDLGSGIPTQGNVHDVVQQVDPGSRVVYVDVDPVAVAHGEAILRDNPNAVAVQADLRRPDEVLSLPAVTELLEPGRPTAVLMMLVLHFVPDEDGPADILRGYREGLGTGSWLALSHGTTEFTPREVTDEVTKLYRTTTMPGTPRNREQIGTLLEGYELVPPGLVLLEQWQPGSVADVQDPERFPVWAGVARAS